MNKKLITIVGLLIIIVVGYVVLGTDDGDVNTKTIKIGAPLVLSGEGAAWGENAKKGIDLAVEEYNLNNEPKVEIIYEDTQGAAKLAVSAYRKLTSVDRVSAIIGPLFQTEVSAIAPLVDEDNVPAVAPSYAPIENRPNPRNPLMIWMDPTKEAEDMAEYVYKEGAKRVGVIGTLDSWENEVSDAFAEKFESLGGTITSIELVQPDTSDVRLTITKVLSEEPEAIFIGTYFQFVQTTRIANELGYEGNLYSIEVDSYLAGETIPFSNGLRYITPDSYATDFVSRYENRYDEKPGIPAGQAYDATNILISFLRNSESPEDVLKAMETFETYAGASGNIVATEDHKTIFPTGIFELQDGKSVRIK